MNTPKTTPYLVSDRAFRIIITEVIERLCLESVDADCFHAVIHLVRNYLTTGELTADAIRLTPHEGYRIFLMFQEMIDKSIRRSRAARAAAAVRKEKKAALAEETGTRDNRSVSYKPTSASAPDDDETSDFFRDFKENFHTYFAQSVR